MEHNMCHVGLAMEDAVISKRARNKQWQGGRRVYEPPQSQRGENIDELSNTSARDDKIQRTKVGNEIDMNSMSICRERWPRMVMPTSWTRWQDHQAPQDHFHIET